MMKLVKSVNPDKWWLQLLKAMTTGTTTKINYSVCTGDELNNLLKEAKS